MLQGRNSVFIGGGVVVVLLLCAILFFALTDTSVGLVTKQGSLPNSATLNTNNTSFVVASWIYGDEQGTITLEDYMAEISAVLLVSDSDSIDLPTAGELSYMTRVYIFADIAEEAGVVAPDDHVKAYISSNYGDYDSIVATGLVSEDVLLSYFRKELLFARYCYQYINTYSSSVETIAAPSAPSDESSYDTDTAEYASYIISLAGDEWDSSASEWIYTGTVYEALEGDFDGQSASYYDAAAAYYACLYEAYDMADAAGFDAWNEYVGAILGSVQLTIYGLGLSS